MKIKEQYKNSNNLNSRINIYQYSDSKLTLSEFFNENIESVNNKKVLELGCGTGLLWKTINEKFINCDITLSDYSKRMIETSKANLKDFNYSYEEIDYHKIPYEDNTFDIIISNHNLYHSNDINLVLSEIHRVLKTDGIFLSTTNSNKHLLQLEGILGRFDINDHWLNTDMCKIFGMETGEEKLQSFFSKIEKYDYNHNLKVTDEKAIYNYFSSISNKEVSEVLESKSDQLSRIINSEIDKNGYYLVKAKAGMFKATK